MDTPYCSVSLIGDSYYRVAAVEWERLCNALDAGDRTIEVQTVDGMALLLVCAQIEAVGFVTPEVRRRIQERLVAEDAEDDRPEWAPDA